jgi:anti-sigma-K factor RskA
MNEQEKLESALIDLLEGRLTGVQARQLEHRIATDPAVKQLRDQLKEVLHQLDQVSEETPPARLKVRFEEALAAEIRNARQTRAVPFSAWIWRIAATVFLVMSAAVLWQWRQQQQELQALREEMARTRQLLLAQLRNTSSASERMDAATVAYTLAQPDDEIVRALVTALNGDRNTNVRLAALDALGKFYREPNVRQELITALATQTDPVVQIALIQLLAHMKEQSVTKELEKIIDDSRTLQPVKDEAHRALLQLS